MKINRIKLSRLQNSSYSQLQTEFKDLIIKFGADSLKISKYFNSVYMVLFMELAEVRRKIFKSAFTELIKDADFVRDEMFLGIRDIVKGNLRHWDTNISEAARRIKIVFKTYGNITRKTLNGQTADTRSLVRTLEKKYSDDISLLKLEDWVAKLKTSNAEFEDLKRKRYKEAVGKPEMSVGRVRKKLDISFRMLCDMLEAIYNVEGSETHKRFIKALNIILAGFSVKTTRRQQSTDKNEGN